MNFWEFVSVAMLLSTLSYVVTTWVKARHGYPLPEKDERGRRSSKREIELLSTENAGLKRQVGRLEERLAVLERIATDPAERTARQIEELR